MSRFLRTNKMIGLVLLIAASALCAYIWVQPWAQRVMRDGFLLGFFPLVGCVSMMLFGAVMIVDPLRNQVPEELDDIRPRDWLTVPFLILGIGIYFAVMQRIGFILITPIFLMVYFYWLGLRPARLVGILGITIPIGIYLLFSLLGVKLPNGVLPAFPAIF
mgnify:CR=1 FL=1